MIEVLSSFFVLFIQITTMAMAVGSFREDSIGWGIFFIIAFLISLLPFVLLIIALIGENDENNQVSIHIISSPQPEPSTEETRKIFSNNLSYYLRLREKSPQALSRALQTSDNEVSKWLNAEKEPENWQKSEIARYLDINIAKLDQNIDHSDIEIRKRTFEKAANIYELIDQFSPEKAEAAERFVELFYNTYNGF